MHEVVVAGHVCLDLIPGLVGGFALTPGRMIEAGPVVLSTGGAVSNTGIALHRLGVSPRLVGKIGADAFGQAIRDVFESHGAGLSQGLVVAPAESSSYTIILSAPGANRMFIHNPGCNATFGADDVADQALAPARLLHFGYPPVMRRIYRDAGAELRALLARARAQGLTTSLDMCMPDPAGPTGREDWRAFLAAALPLVDLFMPSVEELLLMLDPPAFRRLSAAGPLVEQVSPEMLSYLADELLAMGAAVVGLKLGWRGLYLRTAPAPRLGRMGRAAPPCARAWSGRELWAPCYAADVVGTTGAGDATIAGFLLGLLRGMSPEASLGAACAVGACSVEAADALGGLRTWPETSARVAAGWPRLPLDVAAPGWRWSADHELWVGPSNLA